MNRQVYKKTHRSIRHRRVRAKVSGTKERPRISVFKSNKGLFVQFVDDFSGKTMLSNSFKNSSKTKMNKTQIAESIGEALGKKALVAGIKKGIFDKGGFSYHGRIKAVADGLRKAGFEI